MQEIPTHYEVLNVSRKAPEPVIRAAYKVLMQKHHPDKNPGPDSLRTAQRIQAAYDVLSNPLQRQAHDAWIAQQEQLWMSELKASLQRQAPPHATVATPRLHPSANAATQYSGSHSANSNGRGPAPSNATPHQHAWSDFANAFASGFNESFFKSFSVREIVLATGCFLGLLLLLSNSEFAVGPQPTGTANAVPAANAASLDTASSGELPCDARSPRSGTEEWTVLAPRVAPLELITPAGKNYWVRLVQAKTGAVAAQMFLQGGASIKTQVPAGTYEVRYSTGEQWCNSSKLFGEGSQFYKIEGLLTFHATPTGYAGYSLTLNPNTWESAVSKDIDLLEFNARARISTQ